MAFGDMAVYQTIFTAETPRDAEVRSSKLCVASASPASFVVNLGLYFASTVISTGLVLSSTVGL